MQKYKKYNFIFSKIKIYINRKEQVKIVNVYLKYYQLIIIILQHLTKSIMKIKIIIQYNA